MQLPVITFPTWLTIVRIALVPFIIAAIIHDQWTVAVLHFFIAVITDFFDGFLARRWKQESALGAALDPLADKLLMLGCFFTLAFVQTSAFQIPRWFFIVLLAKELFLIIGFLILNFLKKEPFIAQPTMLGKLAACAQFLFVFIVLVGQFFNMHITGMYPISLFLILVLTLSALVQYLYSGYRFLVR